MNLRPLRTITTAPFFLVCQVVCQAACSGPSEGAVSFSDGTPPGQAPTAAPTGSSSGDGGAVNPVFVNEAFPALSVCKSCHETGTSNAPIYFAADAAKTYPIFKTRGYDKGDSLLFKKGLHTGPALTAAQVTALNKWVVSEGNTPAPVPQ